jgi:hypothetical protein
MVELPPRQGVCNFLPVPTKLAIDDELLEQAFQIGGQKTKTATVVEALREYIQRRQQASIVSLFGTIDIDAEYDHKQQRLT